MQIEVIRAALAQHRPSDVAVYHGEELARVVKIKASGKRWDAAAAVLVKLAGWTSLELRGRAGDVLDVIRAEEPEPELEAGGDLEDLGGAQLTAADFALVSRTIIGAQEKALTFRSAEMNAGFNAMVKVMSEMTAAFQGLANMHRAQLDLVQSSIGIGQGDEERGPQSSKLLEMLAPQLLPMLMQGMVAPAPPAPPAPGPNGQGKNHT